MNHTTEELLLAFFVRDAALRRLAFEKPQNLDSAALQRWEDEHPADEYVRDIFKDVCFVSEMLKEQRSAALDEAAQVQPAAGGPRA